MKFLHKYGTRSNEIRRARKELYFRIALVFAVVLFFVGMVLITKFRPRLGEQEASNLPETANVGDPMKNPTLVRLRTEVEALRNDFQAKLAEGSVDEEALASLEKAIVTQRGVIRMRGSEIAPKADVDQLEELLSLYDEEMGGFLNAQSTRMEGTAETHYEQSEYEEALDLLKRARNLQKEINEQFPRSSFRSSTRLHQLNNKLLTWSTKPVADKADQLKEIAFGLMEEKRYAEARETMQKALEAQQSLNESNRGSRFATISRLRQFEEAWKSIQVAEDANTVERLIEESRVALVTDQTDLAITKAVEAEILQSAIAERFPNQPRAGADTLNQIKVLKDTASSLTAYKSIQQMREEVRRLLRDQQVDDLKNAISEWLRATGNFLRNYPQSEYAELIDDQEVGFLHEKRDEIPTLLETVYGNLQAVPGYEDVYLFRTEVSQILYSRVMGENPSSSKAPQLPVESVTWIETNQFIQRLSWILARPVELPSRDLILRAIGEIDAARLKEQAWSSQNTNRETRLVGTSMPNDIGFFDLLGNVSEWLKPDNANRPDRVDAFGGSARDSFLRLATVPSESRSPTERNRFVGFRLIVLMGD